MTQAAGYGPPGESSATLKPAKREDLTVDPQFPDRFRCIKHGLRLEVSGSVLKCVHGCRLLPPAT